MKDIAAEVNLTAASLYHHFDNKDTLLLAVLEAGLETVIARLQPIVSTTASPPDKLREMIAIHVCGLTDNTAVGAAMVFEIRPLLAASGTPRAQAFIRRRDDFEALFRQVIQAGIDQHVFRPVDVPIFVKTMLGAHNWVGVWYRPDGRLDGSAIAGLMADIFLRSLTPS